MAKKKKVKKKGRLAKYKIMKLSEHDSVKDYQMMGNRISRGKAFWKYYKIIDGIGYHHYLVKNNGAVKSKRKKYAVKPKVSKRPVRNSKKN